MLLHLYQSVTYGLALHSQTRHLSDLHAHPSVLGAHLDQLRVVELLCGQGVHLLRTAGGHGQVHVCTMSAGWRAGHTDWDFLSDHLLAGGTTDR